MWRPAPSGHGQLRKCSVPQAYRLRGGFRTRRSHVRTDYATHWQTIAYRTDVSAVANSKIGGQWARVKKGARRNSGMWHQAALLYHSDGGRRTCRNVRNHSPVVTVSHPVRLEVSSKLLRGTRISQTLIARHSMAWGSEGKAPDVSINSVLHGSSIMSGILTLQAGLL